MTDAHATDATRLREFWNRRYATFALSESGWLGAGEALNQRLYACKRDALQRALAARAISGDRDFSILDAGCGQGHFAGLYRADYPRAAYVGVDISERAVTHLRGTMPGLEFHVGDMSDWRDPAGRRFDIVQSFDVLHLILDDQRMVRALASLAAAVGDGGALLVTAALPETTLQPSPYLRYRSRAFWHEATELLGLVVAAASPMYYWLPAGGPTNKYGRYLMSRLGAGALHAVDRAARALSLPQPRAWGPDCRMRLLTLVRR
jgi:SAM-dependent methyltransferase